MRAERGSIVEVSEEKAARLESTFGWRRIEDEPAESPKPARRGRPPKNG
ncbi:DUF7302 family protein [Saccharothrix sp. HUAS TT10]